MNNPENSGDVSKVRVDTDVESAVESLRTMFHLAALCGIVLSATFYIFLHKQVAGMKRQNEELANYIVDYNSNVVPRVELTRATLENYAKMDPSVRPLLLKYFGATNLSQKP